MQRFTEDSIEVVRRFCDTWSTANVDALLSFFAADAMYQNMPDLPAEPARGHEQIRSAIEGFMAGIDRIDFRVHHIVAEGDVVLTERTDVFHLAGGRTIELPVMGAFELTNGKITAWRDYFDLQAYQTELGNGSE